MRRSPGLLLLCLLPLVVGLLARVDPERATLFGIEGPTCPVGALLGDRACPGCGLTRATALGLHGRLAEAVAVHPAGPAVAALALWGVLVALGVSPRGAWARHAPTLLGLAVGLGWLARLAHWT